MANKLEMESIKIFGELRNFFIIFAILKEVVNNLF